MIVNDASDVPETLVKACETALEDIDARNEDADRIEEDQEDFIYGLLDEGQSLEVNDSFRGNYAREDDAQEYIQREISGDRIIGDVMHKQDVGVDDYVYFISVDPSEEYDMEEDLPVILEYQLGVDRENDQVHLNLSDSKPKWIHHYRKGM